MASQIVDEGGSRPEISTNSPQDMRPSTLSEALGALNHVQRGWAATRLPFPSEWIVLRHKLESAEEAVSALWGLHLLLRRHHFARQVAEESAVEYVGLNDSDAESLGSAIGFLAKSASNALEAVRVAVSTKEGA